MLNGDARRPVALPVVWWHWRPIVAMGIIGSNGLKGRDGWRGMPGLALTDRPKFGIAVGQGNGHLLGLHALGLRQTEVASRERSGFEQVNPGIDVGCG